MDHIKQLLDNLNYHPDDELRQNIHTAISQFTEQYHNSLNAKINKHISELNEKLDNLTEAEKYTGLYWHLQGQIRNSIYHSELNRHHLREYLNE